MDVFFFIVLEFGLFVGVPLTFICFVVWQVRRKRRSLPKGAPRGDATASRAEAIALGGLCLSMFTLLALYRRYDGAPYALSDIAPQSARQEYWLVLGGWTLFIAAALAIAWFRRTFVSALSLFVFFCVAGYMVNAGVVFSHKGKEDDVRAQPLGLIVKIKGDVVGADVWFNGVHIGKTPIETDLDEVLHKIPNWNDDRPEEFHDFKQFLSNEHGSFRPLAWFFVQPSKKVGFDEEREESRAIYARVELNGERLYANGHHSVMSGSRIFGKVQPCQVVMDVFVPRWLDDIEALADRARLSDYEVHREWIEAMASYAEAGWMKLRLQSVNEPEFNRVLDAWATELYGLDDVVDEASAWRVFERIRQEANESDNYHTDSPAGRALELLATKLNRDVIVDLAERRIRSFRQPPGWSLTHGFMIDRFHFGTYTDGSWKRAEITPADAVLAHAVWRLDVAFDLEHDSKDNPIEARIVPAMLRLNSTRGTHFDMTQALGGSIFERFALRHNWRKPAEQIEDYGEKLTLSDVEMNRWLHVGATLRSPAGADFRRQNRYQLIQLATKMVRDSFDFQHSWTTNSLDFLFLDVENDSENLAAAFWPTFKQHATRERHSWSQASTVRWKYLTRLQPYCQVQDFVASYTPYCDERCNKTELLILEPHLQLEVLTALVKEADRLINEAKPESSAYYIRQANRDDFAQMARRVSCEESAELLVKWLTEETEEQEQRISRTEQFIEHGQIPDLQLARLAQASDVRLRSLALAGIEQHPTPARRETLKRLEGDEEAQIKAQAALARAAIEAMRDEPLRHRESD